ncbi:hypothetical protein DPMN_186529 [Dreissena polymorpha]|uniref:Uncharacterized protein n=1 Tax=Dreissena polymorpha TaxID=45954 RepID=A0A9D4DLN1_DREPO|nr:hypothetical protein DPMN_186529 [Dreissena polymorpha]
MEQKYLNAKQQLKLSENREKITKDEQWDLMNSARDVQVRLKSVNKHNRKLFESILSVDALIDNPRAEWTFMYEQVKIQFTRSPERNLRKKKG